MALGKAIETLREDITCSICLELMTNPVSIDCGHSYCRSCIMKYFRKQSLWSTCTWKTNCPICRADFQWDSIRPIKQLGNLINIIKNMEQERLCEEHGEQLHLFCEDDKQLICWRCERTPQHSGHVTVLVEDACKVYKDKFQKVLIELKKLEDKNKQWQVNTEEKIQMWQTEINCKRNQIESYFKEFHMILQEEENSCLWRLENARMDVLQRLQESEDKLEKQGQKISNHILELERKCQGSAQDVLQIQNHRFSGKTMASGTALQTLREDITCSICLELMTDPVSIDCGHSYCCSCITGISKQSLKPQDPGNIYCPVCRAEFHRESIRPIKKLENLIDTVKKMEQERSCEKHGEQLHLFCEDDNQLICWRCERTPQHRGHVTVLVEEACEVYKDKFHKVLTELKKLEDKNKQWQVNTEVKTLMWQTEINCKRNQIESYFKEFHMILQEEENSCLWRLENARMDVLQRLQESEDKLKKQGQKISNHILELERKCQGSAQDVLQDVRGTWNRFSALKLHEPEDASLDTHIIENISVRCFKLRKFFDTYGVIITLDSDTAHNDLLLDKNKEKVTWGSQQKKHETSVRFRDLPCVLGCQIFNSGKQFFQVSQLIGPEWDVGVCLENVPRNNGTRDPESGFWAIRYYRGCRYEALTSPPTPLHLNKKILSMMVFLDYENGFVSFYENFTHFHIFTFEEVSFSGPLRAYFHIGQGSSLFLDYPGK